MAKRAYTTVTTKASPQSEKVLGKDQVMNSAGGYVFQIDDWARLDRFLILGSEGNTYYVGERTLTRDNAEAVLRCVKADGKRVVRRIVEVSEAGRAPKNEPAIFALALTAAFGDPETKREAYQAMPRVCRFGTAVMHFAMYSQQLRGWGRGLRGAVARWFNDRDGEDVAYQAIKYQARDGWALSDLLRLAHPVPPDEEHKIAYGWIVDGWPGVGDEPHPNKALLPIWAFEKSKRASTEAEVVSLIRDYNLPFEAVGTEWRRSADVWDALLNSGMGMTAMIRNLATMTRVGLLATSAEAVKLVVDRLTSEEALRRARIHPFAVLLALKTYAHGKSFRGESTWTPVAKIVDALDEAYYLSFGNVEPTGKRMLIALDVSGSMGSSFSDSPLTVREASAAMAMVTARTEKEYEVVGFTSNAFSGWGLAHGKARSKGQDYGDALSVLKVTPRQRLDDVVKTISDLPFGGTDCALPMLWAQARGKAFDGMVVYTDNETWAGATHPFQALKQYRAALGLDTKLVVVGMTATAFSLADPSDPGMLDVVGFDATAPNLIADFLRS